MQCNCSETYVAYATYPIITQTDLLMFSKVLCQLYNVTTPQEPIINFFLANIHLRMINVPSTESYIILFQLTQLLGFLVLLEQLATKPGSTSTTKILSFTCPIGFKFKVLFHSSLKHIVMKMPLTSTSVFLSKLACAYGCSFL